MIERMIALFKKELKTLPFTTVPPLTVGIISFSIGIISLLIYASTGATYKDAISVLVYYFYILSLFAGMFLSVPSITYEKRYKMLDLLLIHSLKEFEIISGKIIFYTMISWLIIAILFILYTTLVIPASLYIIYSTILSLLFVIYYAVSIGVFSSTITSSIAASFFTATMILLLIDIGGFLSGLFTQPLKDIFSYFHAINHYMPLTRGAFSFKNLFFFLSAGLFFHYLSVLILTLSKHKGKIE